MQVGMCNAIRGSPVDRNSSSTSGYSHSPRRRTRHTQSPGRLSSSSPTYSVESLPGVGKSSAASLSARRNARERPSTMRGKEDIRW